MQKVAPGYSTRHNRAQRQYSFSHDLIRFPGAGSVVTQSIRNSERRFLRFLGVGRVFFKLYFHARIDKAPLVLFVLHAPGVALIV